MPPEHVLVLALAASVAMGACSSSKTPGAPAGGADSGASDGVPSPGLPQVQNRGGAVLAAPHARVVTFAGDPNAARVEALVAGLGRAAHWKTALAEYGVGALVADAPVRLTDAAPTALDSAGVQRLLAQQLDGAHALGAPDPSTVYVLVFPASTALTSSLGAGCQEFGGYHAELTVSALRVPYAVLPTCDHYLGLTGTDALVANVAHELVEAASDPFTITSPAFGALDDLHAAWGIAWGAYEIADLCAQNGDVFYTPTDFSFVLPRSWSNAAAKAGHDPCVPAAAGPYFVTLAPADDTFDVTIDGTKQSARGIAVPLGQSRTVPLALWADRAVDPWSIAFVDESSWKGGAPRLTFAIDRTSAKVGDVVSLTIHAVARGTYGVAPFLIQSSGSGRVTTTVGLVGE